MADSCYPSDLLDSASTIRNNKRPLEYSDVDSWITEDGLSSSAAKRIHIHSDDNEVGNLQNGSLDKKDVSLDNHVLTGSVNEEETSSSAPRTNTTSHLASEVPKDLPVVLNLSKNEVINYPGCSINSPVNDDYKENSDEANNMPMDLSKGRKTVSTTPVSNGLDGKMNCYENRPACPISENMVAVLAAELRNEETKLVLLKKIRQSQLLHHLMKDAADGRPIGVSSQPIPGPPPLIRGLQQVSSAYRTTSHTNNVPRLLPSRGSHQPPYTHGPPPLVVPSRSSAPSVSSSVARSPHTVNPPPAQATPPSTHSITQNSRPQTSVHSQHTPALPIVQPEQTPAQRQAAAKLALRKQLEKTLLQIPPPKPPPPEMNFIPNVGNSDFVMLLGLEEAVKCILDNDARARGEPVSEVKYVFYPFQCVQCHTDFTPVWKRDKPGSKNVICERCVTNNQKWALKQEHTNRLKSAFVKALQQEQEIEQSLLAQSAISVPSPHLVSSSSHSSSLVPKNLSTTLRSELETSHQQSRHHQQHQHYSQQQQARHTTLWTPPTMSNVVGLSQAFDPRLMFPFHRPPVTSKSPVDIQRQYLLDLIPQRSHLDGPVLWRT